MEAAPSLTEVLATLPDPRDPSGRRYPLPVMLHLVVVATLADMRSLEAIAQFARDHGAPLAHALGRRSARTPCKATLSNLLRRLDAGAVEAAPSRWIAARRPDLGGPTVPRREDRAGHPHGTVPGVHRLAADAPCVAAVAAQVRVAGKTNEHKAALELLGALPLAGSGTAPG